MASVIRTWWALPALLALLLTSCSSAPPDRQTEVTELATQIGRMPGVHAVSSKVTNHPDQGLVNFTISVQTAADITTAQLAAVTARYLRALDTIDFTGYRTEFDARRGWNVFAVDGGRLPIVNDEQIVSQAEDWVRLRHEFPDATVTMRAAIAHPGGKQPVQEWGHSSVGSIQLADSTDYRDAAAAITALTARYPQLASFTWTVSAGVEHPADIKSTHRYPTEQELALWHRINADQSIPHESRLIIGGRVSSPVWIAEKTTAHDPSAAAALAAAHLPLVAQLPVPVLYTASDQIQGHISGDGRATGPVAVTTRGCTDRDYRVYQPPPQETALINTYETCKH